MKQKTEDARDDAQSKMASLVFFCVFFFFFFFFFFHSWLDEPEQNQKPILQNSREGNDQEPIQLSHTSHQRQFMFCLNCS